MRISEKRWQEAQVFEFDEWNQDDTVVDAEWEEAFDKYHDYFQAFAAHFNVTNDWEILDVGCSATCISRMLPQGTRTGIEPLADKLGLNERVEGIDIVDGMAEDMPFDAHRFDLVICRNVIDHTHKPETAMREMKRVLNPEGYLVFACYVYNPFIALVRIVGEKIHVFRNVGHPHTYTMRSLEALARKEFIIRKRTIIHEGVGPDDFGKRDEAPATLSTIQRAVLFINTHILRNKWFVREYLLLCTPRS